jgi:hypothetical protein
VAVQRSDIDLVSSDSESGSDDDTESRPNANVHANEQLYLSLVHRRKYHNSHRLRFSNFVKALLECAVESCSRAALQLSKTECIGC